MKEFLLVDAPHPSTIDEELLLRHCKLEFGRGTGPGGQRRNKVATACEIVHEPTGVMAHAAEMRKQADNRRVALRRLRDRLARVVRTSVHHERYRPSALWEKRRQGRMLPVNPKHYEYPALLAEALDVIVARRWDVAGTAGVLGIP